MESQQESRLLKLPRELRDQIYQDAFQDNFFDVDKKQPDIAWRRDTIGLLLSCKQIYEESIKLYYKHTTFLFVDWDEGIEWLTQIPLDYLDLISDLRFDTSESFLRKFGIDSPHGHNPRMMASGLDSLIRDIGGEARGGVQLRPGVLKASVLLKDGTKYWSSSSAELRQMDHRRRGSNKRVILENP